MKAYLSVKTKATALRRKATPLHQSKSADIVFVARRFASRRLLTFGHDGVYGCEVGCGTAEDEANVSVNHCIWGGGGDEGGEVRGGK